MWRALDYEDIIAMTLVCTATRTRIVGARDARVHARVRACTASAVGAARAMERKRAWRTRAEYRVPPARYVSLESARGDLARMRDAVHARHFVVRVARDVLACVGSPLPSLEALALAQLAPAFAPVFRAHATPLPLTALTRPFATPAFVWCATCAYARIHEAREGDRAVLESAREQDRAVLESARALARTRISKANVVALERRAVALYERELATPSAARFVLLHAIARAARARDPGLRWNVEPYRADGAEFAHRLYAQTLAPPLLMCTADAVVGYRALCR